MSIEGNARSRRGKREQRDREGWYRRTLTFWLACQLNDSHLSQLSSGCPPVFSSVATRLPHLPTIRRIVRAGRSLDSHRNRPHRHPQATTTKPRRSSDCFRTRSPNRCHHSCHAVTHCCNAIPHAVIAVITHAIPLHDIPHAIFRPHSLRPPHLLSSVFCPLPVSIPPSSSSSPASSVLCSPSHASPALEVKPLTKRRST